MAENAPNERAESAKKKREWTWKWENLWQRQWFYRVIMIKLTHYLRKLFIWCVRVATNWVIDQTFTVYASFYVLGCPRESIGLSSPCLILNNLIYLFWTELFVLNRVTQLFFFIKVIIAYNL